MRDKMTLCVLLVVFLSGGMTFSLSDIQNELQDLKKGQEEIKNMLREILYQFNKTEKTTPVLEKPLIWQKTGSSLKFVKKVTSSDNVRLQVELSLSPGTEVQWVVDSTIVGTKESKFGTSSTKLERSTQYTIDLSKSVEFLELISVTPENVYTRYNIDVQGNDSTRYFNDSVCQAAINETISTSASAFFRCSPELDPRDSWYQDMGLITRSENEKVRFKTLEIEPNPYINVTYDRNTTANGTVIFSNEILEKTKSFMFVSSILTVNVYDIVKSITHRYTQDISAMKKDGEFGFIDNTYLDPKLSEGRPVTISCEAIGRNPPPIRVEKNGMTISDTDEVYITSSRSTLWSTFYVTYLHASKEIEGNYTCVADGESREVFPLYNIELKPKVIWDLMYGANVTDESKHLVLEGSEGLDVSCSNSDNDTVVGFDKVQRTTLTKWTERLEVWIPRPSQQQLKPFRMWYISCTATDKNGENTFELYV